MNELERLINLAPYLRAHPIVSVAEAAEAFGITEARLLADLQILQYVGVPGGYYGDLFEVDLDGARSDGWIHATNLDALGRPMRLARSQVTSLLVALAVVVELGGDTTGARSAIAKLQGLLGQAGPGIEVRLATGPDGVRATLAEALERGRVVHLRYRKGGRGEPEEATVEPGRLRNDGGYVYLDAWSRKRDEWRSFRLDHVLEVTMLDEGHVEREVPASLDTWFADATRQLTVTVTDAGRWCADYHPTSAVERDGDLWRITFPLVSLDWGAHLVLRLGDALRAIDDEEVAGAARTLASEALEHYRG
ncbi:YafY family protein [uncultured Tessaracoccus sp.]|uniref:helix-turn-helix transcriptional regulator n=1 Tax=uncultured Tessaracoccus sp. TaxID=905023 RepID=UPI0025E4E10E|nr:WYL domain-containing protein [uncultured Tessaracoccus sp.]